MSNFADINRNRDLSISVSCLVIQLLRDNFLALYYIYIMYSFEMLIRGRVLRYSFSRGRCGGELIVLLVPMSLHILMMIFYCISDENAGFIIVHECYMR